MYARKDVAENLMNNRIFSTSGFLVPQDLWLPKDARKSVKTKKAVLGPLFHATTGTEVARMWQVWSQVLDAVMESK